MPKLKKKNTKNLAEEPVIGEIPEIEEVVEATDVAEVENLNTDEETALSEQVSAEAENTVHTDKLNRALKVVHDRFNLDGYNVMSFKDQGNKVEVSVTNGDFDLTIKIRDCENEGIY